MNFLSGIVLGFALLVILQMHGWCGNSCREGYMQKAMNDNQWSKEVWEEIGQRYCDQKSMCFEGKE